MGSTRVLRRVLLERRVANLIAMREWSRRVAYLRCEVTHDMDRSVKWILSPRQLGPHFGLVDKASKLIIQVARPYARHSYILITLIIYWKKLIGLASDEDLYSFSR